ncbi:MBL fold metallo-hydrolase [Barnesiella sp. WM24]|uniref:MBL fold metallo-hydrolase n=1 Tax=Bacteroidales TaxID=171549 RepID=UPI000F48BCCC|nr:MULTISPECIES: MBL fold metallo-hydrolase [Bacteroidales]MCX4279062.1 MBL fold metallo-hydrolase [Muribaculum sp.]ROS92473.1 MBL fold metallo-hydrolase [Muribaculaceae bacterium Isolate-043 (Harlan)]ROT08826.1 MBL fold metallo-hydrolase [Muribaculaceae bacterium Isolate-037 (Harlan)]TFU91722.1 MBL fold metallo-hydrolase [Barnesiella sp. WM24]
MKLKVLGSSSAGNCYVLDNGNEALILEAGVAFAKVKKALGFNLRKVAGCLITHQHNDHAKYIRNVVECGITTLALPEVWTAKQIESSRAVAVQPYKGYKLGRFKVLPFPACHDVPCVGYHIIHPDCGRMLFLTDSCDCLQIFPQLNHLLIECNYSTFNLLEAVNKGYTLKSQIERLPNSHMELDTCKRVIREHDLTDVQEIVLLHLSAHNSDREHFISEIERHTGKVVYAASPGLTIDITKY